MSSGSTTGWLHIETLRFPCVLGRAGRSARKREGDGTTPIGTWRPTDLFYRAGKMVRPQTGLPCRPISSNDGWCDDPRDRNYNRAIQHPYPASAEYLWRSDNIYDLVVALDHNVRPRIKGAGSAIFIHVARDDLAPTEGCIALEEKILRLLIAKMCTRTRIKIGR